MCPFNTRTASIPDWWPTFSIKLSKRRLFAIRRRNEDPTRRSPSSSSKGKVFKETSWKRKLLPKISQTFPPLSAPISILNEAEELEAKGFVYRYSWNQLFSYPNPNILCQSSHGSYWNYKSLISVLHYRQSLNLFKFNFMSFFSSSSVQSFSAHSNSGVIEHSPLLTTPNPINWTVNSRDNL